MEAFRVHNIQTNSYHPLLIEMGRSDCYLTPLYLLALWYLCLFILSLGTSEVSLYDMIVKASFTVQTIVDPLCDTNSYITGPSLIIIHFGDRSDTLTRPLLAFIPSPRLTSKFCKIFFSYRYRICTWARDTHDYVPRAVIGSIYLEIRPIYSLNRAELTSISLSLRVLHGYADHGRL